MNVAAILFAVAVLGMIFAAGGGIVFGIVNVLRHRRGMTYAIHSPPG